MTKPLVVDFHVHFLEKDVLEQANGKTVLTGFGTRQPATAGGAQRIATLDKMLLPQRQIEDMDRLGIDLNVITSSTVIGGTSWADAKTEAELVKRVNDRAAAWCAAFPQRFVGSFVLPLQDIDLSMREFERATGELGLRVANLGASYGGLYLGHARFHPLWEAVRNADVTVFIHPEDTKDLWFQDFGLWNSVGQPIEEAKFIASLIYEGVLEQRPGLKVVVAHGGGYLPHYFGRLDRNVKAHPHSAVNISRRPSEYLRDLHYDTCLYEPAMLEALVARVGADRLVMGSDWPVGDTDPVGFVERCRVLGAADVEMVVGGTLAGLLGLTTVDDGLGVIQS
jgi:aminocarboxymuconate-semialdehyde decarboxylase